MEKTVVFGTGLSGLVGSKIVADLGHRFTFRNLDLTNGVDILKPESIENVLKDSHPGDCLLHLAAFTDVNAAQEQDGDKSGVAYQVNMVGTKNIAEAAKKFGLHLIHFSTSYVFDGEKKEAYTEGDKPNPTDWYSKTKLEAEKVVQEILPTATILRIAFPYRQDEFAKADIWHKMANTLKEGKTGPFFADHFFTLTPLEWLTPIIAWCIENKPAGIFHATSDKIYTDLSLAQEIAQSLGITTELQASSVANFNETASRRYQPSLVLSHEKLKKVMARDFPQT